MRAGVAVPDQLLSACVEVLLRTLHALAERRRSGGIQDPDTRAGAHGHVDPKQAGVLIGAARADRPDLTRRQRVRPDLVLALQLGRRNELLHTFGPEVIAEVRVAELGRADTLLLLLHAAAAFDGQPHGPLKILV